MKGRTKEKKASAPPSRWRRWRRRLLWSGATLLVIAIALRVALWLAMPSILRRVAASHDLSCSYERMDLSILGADAEVWHLVVGPAEGGEPYVDVEYCRVDVAVWELLHGRIVVRRIEADGVDVRIDRREDGSIPLLQHLARQKDADEPPPAPATGEPDKPPGDLDLSTPVRVDALRLQHVHFDVHDRSVQPPLDTRLNLNVRVSSLGVKDRPVRFQVDLFSHLTLDRLHVEGLLSGAGNEREVDLEVRLRGLRPHALEGYLHALGLRPAAREIGASFGMRVATRAAAQQKGAVEVELELEDLQADHDGETFLALERMSLEAPVAGLGELLVKSLVIEGGRLEASRSSSGVLQLGGIELDPAAPPVAGASRTPPAPVREGAGGPAGSSPAPGRYRVVLERLSLADLVLKLHDAAVEPATDLAIRLESLDVSDIVRDPQRPDAPLRFQALVRAPGLWESLNLEGEAAPFSAKKTFDYRLEMTGIAPSYLDPYLAELNAASTWEAGTFSLDTRGEVALQPDGSLGGRLELEGILLKDGEELLGIDGITISGVNLHPGKRSLEVEAVEVRGPRLAARQDASGAVEALGLRLLPAASESAVARAQEPGVEPAESSPPGATPATPAERLPWSRIRLGTLSVSEARFRLLDQGVAPEVTHEISDAGLLLEDLGMDLDPQAAEQPPASLEAWLVAPDLCERVSVTGSITTRGLETSVDLAVDGRGITGRSLASYLKPAGLDLRLDDATGTLRLRAGCDPGGDAVRVDARISAARLSEDDRELLGVDELRIEGVRLGRSSIEVESVGIESPRLRAWRDKEGLVHAGGLVYQAVTPAATSAGEPSPGRPSSGSADSKDEAPPSDEPPEQRPIPGLSSGDLPPDEPLPAPPPQKTQRMLPALPELALGSLRVSGARLHWSDSATKPELETMLEVDSELDALHIREGADPADFRISTRADGLLGESTVTGTIRLEQDAIRLSADVSAAGLRTVDLAAYLPPEIEPTLEKGVFRVQIETGVSWSPREGFECELTMNDLEYGDEAMDAALLRFETARLLSGIIDPAGGVVSLKECSLAGLEADVERTADGALALLGFHLRPSVPQSEDSEGDPKDTVETADTAPATASPGKISAPQATVLLEELPLFTLERLAAGIRRLSFTDRLRPDAAPIVIRGLQVSNPQPLELLGADPDANPPAKLLVEGRLEPVVDSFRVDAEVNAFHAEPSVHMTFIAEGFRGQGVTAVIPELREKVDGSRLEDGRIEAKLEAVLMVQRLGALAFDFSRPYGGDLTVKNASFRNTAEGPVLLGLEELTLTKLLRDPRSGSVAIESMDLAQPQGQVYRDADGLHVLDFVIKLPEPAAESAGAPAVTTEEPAAESVGESAEQPSEPSGPEIRLDRLYVHGIDFVLEDRSVDPPLRVPLADLDVEARELSSYAPYREEPIFVSLLLKAGDVSLRAPPETGMLAGVLSDAGSLVTGGEIAERRPLEERPLFEEITGGFELTLKPPLRGRARLVVNGFELEALRGLAAKRGIDLDSGVLDTTADLVFTDEGLVHTDARISFADLSVSEPPGGPIYRYLHLPAPLQTVVFALRDRNGILRVPLSLSMKSENFSGGNYLSAVATTLGKLLGTAFLKSPLRLGAAVTDFVPFIGGGGEIPEEIPLVLEYGPAQTRLNSAQERALEPFIERLDDGEPILLTLRHQLGMRDLAIVDVLGNPSREDIKEVVQALRRRKDLLLEDRRATATRTVVTLGAGLEEEGTRARLRLREIERELGVIEDDLDELYELLRSGAQRRTQRRARAAGVALGQDRLAEIRQILQRRLGWESSELETHLRLMRPRFRDVTETPSGRVTVTVGPQEEE